MRSKPIYLLILVFCVLSFVSCGDMPADLTASMFKGPGGTANCILEGDTADLDVALPDSQGNSHNILNESQGKVILINFTMWCAICKRHYDSIMRDIYESYKGYIESGDFAIYLVDYVNSDIGAAEGYRQTWGIPSDITVLVDTENTLTDLYCGTMGITIVVDQTGKVQINGDYDAAKEEIRDTVEYLLKGGG